MRTLSDLKQQPSTADLRGFRLVLSIGGMALSLFLYFVRHRYGAAAGLLAGALTIAVLSFVPGLGRWLFAGWMGVGLILGRVTTPILLGVVWLVLFAPLAIAFRLLGRDAMKRPFPSSEATFWEPHAAVQARSSGMGDFFSFLSQNKKWWLLPLVVVLVGLGALAILGGTAAAPFIYTLF